MNTVTDRFHKRYLRNPNGCWIWQGTYRGKGYGEIRIKTKKYYPHRAAWMLFKGEIPDGFHVLHSCDNPRCVNPDHLFIGTNYDNIMDRVRKDRSAEKLSAKDVRSIRLSDWENKELAEKYKVSSWYIGKIKEHRERVHVS